MVTDLLMWMSTLLLLSAAILANAETSHHLKPYHLWRPHEFAGTLRAWHRDYPDLVRVTTAQGAYGLPHAGTQNDCPYEKSTVGCSNYILTLQDFIAHPEGSESSKHLPEVLWNGCIHGDERVGPTVVMESAFLLLEAASCEAKPNRNSDQPFDDQVRDANSCRAKLREKGIDDTKRKWLARLVSTRRIVVVPTANALGFFRNERTEDNVDPAADFPFDQAGTDQCMQTIAARTLNEVFREHIFQHVISFTSASEAGIGYSWAAPSNFGYQSPDNFALNQIGNSYCALGGRAPTCVYGEMNERFHRQLGKMEDWSYAASWDVNRVVNCSPQTFKGYPKQQTTYDNSTLRALHLMIATNQEAILTSENLGNSLDLFDSDRKKRGIYVARNMRYALLSAELVEPYVSIFGVNDISLTDDIVPLIERKGRSCELTKAVAVPMEESEVYLEWTVGGALHISKTEIWYAKWDDIAKDQLDCFKQPENIDGFVKANVLAPTYGSAFFSSDGPNPPPSESKTSKDGTMGPVFRGKIDISNGFKKDDRIVVIAKASVDQDWADSPRKKYDPEISPQSHLINARTNKHWRHRSGSKRVHGRLDWYSTPVTIVLDDYDLTIGALELYDRFGEGLVLPPSEAAKGTPSSTRSLVWKGLMIVIGIMSLAACCVATLRHRSENLKAMQILQAEMAEVGYADKPAYRDNVEESYGDPDFDSLPYTDDAVVVDFPGLS